MRAKSASAQKCNGRLSPLTRTRLDALPQAPEADGVDAGESSTSRDAVINALRGDAGRAGGQQQRMRLTAWRVEHSGSSVTPASLQGERAPVPMLVHWGTRDLGQRRLVVEGRGRDMVQHDSATSLPRDPIAVLDGETLSQFAAAARPCTMSE
jgi:hypothetical protein